jgi:hypothetical protein
MESVDVWRTAHLLITLHGEHAGFFAAQRADELLAAGDRLGCSVFMQVHRAIKDLSRQAPREGEAVN